MDDELARLERATGWRIADVATLHEGLWDVGGDASVSFPAAAHDHLAPLEEAGVWFRLRNEEILARLCEAGLPTSLWDVGAGNGMVASHLRASGIDVVAVEPLPEGARRCARRGVPTIRGTLEALHLPDGALEGVGLFDVVEHLEEPGPLLSEVARVLRPGGLVAVSAPAMPWLWSDADRAAGHFRRYRVPDLTELLERAGFCEIHAAYWLAAAVVPLWLRRAAPYRAGRRRTHDAVVRSGNRDLATGGPAALHLGRLVNRAERRVRRRVGVPVGTSVMATARRSFST